MKKVIGGLIAPILALLLAFAPTVRASTQDFTIDTFTADYYLNRADNGTATMTVNESIIADFPNFDQNHGILRAIPEKYQGHTLSLKINSVTNGQQAWHYTSSHENNNLVLKIGDADRFVHGQQRYDISYSLRNVVDVAYEAGDELYWDVNGDQWPQTTNTVLARVHIPASLTNQLQARQVCYAGSYGNSIDGLCSIKRQSSGDGVLVTAQTNHAIAPYQTLTFVLGFNKGTFQLGPEVAHEQDVQRLKLVGGAALILVPPLLAFRYMFKRWRQFGNDPKSRGVIIPEYEPPDDFSVLASQYMRSYSVDQRSFSAAIIQLAVQRYLNIYESKQKKKLRKDTTDYELELIKDPGDLPEEMQKVIEILFENQVIGQRIKLSEYRKTHTNIYSDINDLRKKLAKRLTNEGYFQHDPTNVRNSYMGWAAALTFVSFGLIFVWPLTFLALGGILAGIVMFIFALIMPARTEKGVLAHDALLGLRDYIKLAESDRLKYLQSAKGAEKIDEPGKFYPKSKAQKVKLFESLLPFAMLFGLEKSWANQFKSIYTQPPDWYHGNFTSFNAAYLGSNLNSFATASTVSFSSPSSSSGSGFSSGGGFSGGGGGGGGGGGW